MFKRIDHIALVVKDKEKSIHFYEKYFGFKKYYESESHSLAAKSITFLKLGDSAIELIDMSENPEKKGFHFCLESDHFDEDYLYLKKEGIPVYIEPTFAGVREPREKGSKRAIFIGPDGELIEIRGQ